MSNDQLKAQQPIMVCTLKIPFKKRIQGWFRDAKYWVIIKYRTIRKRNITEQMGLQEAWYKEAHEIRDFKQLKKFMKKLMSYTHDYGTICHATAAAAIAASWVIDRDPISGGISGFQASCIMWEYIQHWAGKKPPLRLLEMDNMLYPQYKYMFEKTIDKSTFEYLQAQARNNLNNRDFANSSIRKHWQSIVNGKVPFGYKIKEEK